MVVVIPSGQSHQLVGLPPLSDETYERLGKTIKDMFAEIKQSNSADPSDYYTI